MESQLKNSGKRNYAVVWKIGEVYFRRTYVSLEVAESWHKNRKSCGVDSWYGTMADYKRVWTKLEVADKFDAAMDEYFLHPTHVFKKLTWLEWKPTDGKK